MQRFLLFLFKNKYLFLFLFLELIAFTLIIQQHSYQSTKFINSSNSIVGSFYEKTNSIDEFFNLKNINQELVKENSILKNKLALKVENEQTKSIIDTLKYHQTYQYIVAKVINNNYIQRNNYITLNKGSKDGITKDMGVITEKGLIGIVKNVSKNYATVLSVLSKFSYINARLSHNFHYGTLVWNGKNYRTVNLKDLPRQAIIKVGDTIISGGKSTTFPEGIPIGTIKDIVVKNKIYQKITINLFQDFSNLGYVYVVKNLDKHEIKKLLNKTIHD